MSVDRGSLLECYANAGAPVATIYLPAPSDRFGADEQLEIRKKNVAADLADASDELRARVDATLAGLDHDSGAAFLLVVGEEGVRLESAMHRPVAKTLVRVGPCPELLPMLEATQVDVPHLAVLIDRTGADVHHRVDVGAVLEHSSVEGDDVRVHRGHPGGWSQKRFQQTAENAWENNAKDVVDEIVSEYADIDLLFAAGDVRAVGFFTDHLPERIDATVLDGSRHAEPDAMFDAVDVALRDRAAERMVTAVDEFRSHVGAGTGSAGMEVLEHLTHGRVQRLLVANDTLDEDRATSRFDFDQPAHLPPDNHDRGVIAAVTDGAVALAHATGAEVLVTPKFLSGMEDGLGAVLRY